MEPAQDQIRLGEMPVGTRLLVRSKKDWRPAVVSRVTEEQVTVSIASPTGYNYRLRRDKEAIICFDGAIPILLSEYPDTWRENLSVYDPRW